MKRNFGLKLHKHGFWHRANPFNAMMKARLRNTLGVATATKTLFTSPVLDQGPTMTCAEHEACAEQAAIDGIAYDVQQFLAAVCGFLNILPSQYSGTDMKTVMAASISPGLTPVGQTKPTVQASAVMWITPENGMDLYDTLQTYIDLYQRPLGFGVMWMNDWEGGQNGVVPSSLPESSLGSHCTMWCGKVRSGEFLGVTFPEPDRMLNQNSWGVNAPGSARGYYLFPRNIVNMCTGSYGCAVKVFSTDATVILLGKLSMLYVKVIDLIASVGNKKTSAVVPPIPHVSLIPAFATGIFIAEGNGKQAGVKNNNWGDLRFTGYTKSLGATSEAGGFAVFPTVAIGDAACEQLCRDVANNLLKGYPKPCTIQQFVKVYGEPPSQLAWDNYVSILLRAVNNPKITATSLMSELL